jgi:hypothetical protein
MQNLNSSNTLSKIPTIRAKSLASDAAKITEQKSKIPIFGYQTDNSLAQEIKL